MLDIFGSVIFISLTILICGISIKEEAPQLILVAFLTGVLGFAFTVSVIDDHIERDYAIIEILSPEERTYDGVQYVGTNYTVYLIYNEEIYKCSVPTSQIERFEVGETGMITRKELFDDIKILNHEPA